MKKNYYSLFAAAMMLAATSCSQEEDFAQSSSTEKVTFEVNLEGAAQSRTAGDGMTATKLYYEVYQGTRKVLDNFGEGKNRDLVTLNGGKATIEMPLLRGEKYDIMFWAQADGSIYNPADLQNITVSYGDATANNEAYDAFFYGEQNFEPNNNVTKIELRRPFAQLNIGTTEADWNQAIQMIGGTSKPVTTSKVTVSGLAKAFDVLTGEATGSQDYTFETADLLKDANGVPTETFTAKNGGTYYNLAMNYLMVPGKVTAETPEVKSTTSVTATFWRDAEELFTLENIVNVPIQRNWRTNIIGNLLADNKTFEIEIVPGFENDYEKTLVSVNTPEEFAAALQQDLEHIVIDLVKVEGRAADAKEYTLAIGANTEKYYFGSAKTKTITINANGNTINFVHENGDWNYIRCANEAAKWIINNAHLTNSGKNNGPWNRHDIRFYNAVELNNVTSDKAIALLNDGKLNNVDITEDGDVYALWITAAGQSVEINDLDIVSVGRGIAIKDEYVDNKAKVTLNVKNAKFDTQKKAAILVSSTAGADITLENLDLSGVAADKINAVWVDNGDKYQNIDDVNVNGGFVKIESAEDTAETNPFLVEGATVYVTKGVYGTLPKMANGVTIIAEEGTVFKGTSSVAADNVTIKNITFKGTDKALTNGLKNVTFESCHFNASEAVRYCYAYGDVVFNDCTFGDENCVRGIHFDGGDGTVTLNNCTLYGFNAMGSALTKVTFNNCQFPKNNRHNVLNMYSVYEFNNCQFNPEMHTDCAGNNVTATFNGCSYTDGSSIYSLVRFDKDATTCSITIDGEEIHYANNATNLATLFNQYNTIYLANGNFGTIVAKSNKTIIGTANAKVDAVNLNGAENLTLKNIKFDAATAKQNYDKKGVGRQYANIITGDENYNVNKGAMNLVIEGCTFEGTYVNAGSAISFADRNRNSGSSDNITIKNCTFNTVGGNYDIYGYYFGNGNNFVIENNTFNSTLKGKPLYLGQYKSNIPVEINGNEFKTVSSIEAAVTLQAHSGWNVSYNASGNTFAQQ